MIEIKEISCKINGFEIAYTDTGPQDGRLLFCVHGLLSNGRDYDFLALSLAEQGFRVISIDLPGRGKSARFKHAMFYALPSYLPYCIGLIKDIAGDRSFDFMGVSLGGLIGMNLALNRALKLERLILVDIGPEIPDTALNAVADYAKTPTLFKNRQDAIDFFKKRCSGWGITQDVVWDHLIKHNIVERADGACEMHYDSGIGKALKTKNRTVKAWRLWKKVTQPVLLVRGGHSSLLTAYIAAEMQNTYTGAKMDEIVFAECGHVPNLMQEEQIIEISGWLIPPA